MNDQIDFEVRFSDPGDSGEIEGTAVKFDTIDSYRTTFAPTAFNVAGRSIPMLWSHDPSQVIGSWSSFQIRDGGLTAKGKLNLAVAKAIEVRALLKAGDVSGLSIGFSTLKDERQANGIRRITEARLHEISVVTFASVPGSGITKIRQSENGTDHASAMASFAAACRSAALAIKGQ
jgi:HK97 family phage prohead protease